MENILQKTLEIDPKSLEVILDAFIFKYRGELITGKVRLTGEKDFFFLNKNRIEIYRSDNTIPYSAAVFYKNIRIGEIMIFRVNQNKTYITIDLNKEVEPPYTESEYLEFKSVLENLKDEILLYSGNKDQLINNNEVREAKSKPEEIFSQSSNQRIAPTRQADLDKWKAVWNYIESKHWLKMGMSPGKIREYLKNDQERHSFHGTVFSVETIKEIIRSGRVGELS